MFKFPHAPTEKPSIRLILPYEVIQNREILEAAIRYIQHYARIELASVLLLDLLASDGQRSVNTVKECGVQQVFANITTARYNGTGGFRIPIAGVEKSVLLSQRRITLDAQDKRQELPSGYEFAQACGRDAPIPADDVCNRFRSVEMISGFVPHRGQGPLDTVQGIIGAIRKAPWAHRVSQEQLATPEATGRLFGYRDERPTVA